MQYRLVVNDGLVIVPGLKAEFPNLNLETGEEEITEEGFVLDPDHPNAFRTLEDGCFALQECNPYLKDGDEFWHNGKLILTCRLSSRK